MGLRAASSFLIDGPKGQEAPRVPRIQSAPRRGSPRIAPPGGRRRTPRRSLATRHRPSISGSFDVACHHDSARPSRARRLRRRSRASPCSRRRARPTARRDRPGQASLPWRAERDRCVIAPPCRRSSCDPSDPDRLQDKANDERRDDAADDHGDPRDHPLVDWPLEDPLGTIGETLCGAQRARMRLQGPEIGA